MNQFSVVLETRSKFFISVLILVTALLSSCATFRDADPDRGATTVKHDVFGDSVTAITYLDQGWTPADSLWFYTTTQGSDLMPYDFFVALEQVGKPEPFRSNGNMNHYRYLPQKVTSSNPDGLAVGFVKDVYQGKEYIGLTCAACHTGQINYKGKGIRIDGAPAIADMETFIRDIVIALQATRKKDDVRKRFVENVMARGNYATEADVLADLKKYSERLANYITINYSSIHYGYARLDAFGRIYNRVLQHIVNVRVLDELLRDPRVMGDRAMTDDEINSITSEERNALSGAQRDYIVEKLVKILNENNGWEALGRLRLKLFNPADAPVSYPFLWDTPQHDYVQWNGLTENAGLRAMARDVGEAIGVFGTLDWTVRKGFSLPALITGQSFYGTHVSFDSSIKVNNLRRIESRLWRLRSPLWSEEFLEPIDETRVVNGKSVFNKYCVSCHARIIRDDPDRRVVAHMSRTGDVGTDPQMAENSINYEGFSGILRNQYVGVSVGDILIDRRAPVSALLTKATIGVVATPEPDKWVLRRWAEWIYNLAVGFHRNEIKPSIKHGNYDPDTTANPVASLKAYKARSLNGVWATAPYLHNGSVPTLYDLLLPKKRPGDPRDGEYRPDKFVVGSREFDPVKVGLKSSGYDGFIFNTNLPGNSNAGHDYGVKRLVDDSRGPVDQKLKAKCLDETIKDEYVDEKEDKCLLPMSGKDRWDLLEYLKTL